MDYLLTLIEHYGLAAVFVNVLVEQLGASIPAESEVIVYCARPNEASAARVAKQFIQKAYTRERPLHGGIDARIAAGYTLESWCRKIPFQLILNVEDLE